MLRVTLGKRGDLIMSKLHPFVIEHGKAGSVENIIFKTSAFTREDVQQVVDIHINEMSRGFFGSLGNKPLKLVYSHASKSKSCILILAVDPGKDSVCGFIFGVLDTNKFCGEFLKQRFFQSLLYIFPRVLSFSKLKKIMETLARLIKKRFLNIPKAGLLVFAVKEEYRGSGLAKRLFDGLVGNFKEKNVKEFEIIAGEDLVRAQRFYEKTGAVKVNTLKAYKGTRSSVYVYRIP